MRRDACFAVRAELCEDGGLEMESVTRPAPSRTAPSEHGQVAYYVPQWIVAAAWDMKTRT